MLRTIARLFSLVLALTVMAGQSPAHAQKLPEAVTLLLEDSFPATASAIELIAASGAPHAADAIEALGDRRLLASASTKTVLVRGADGRHLDLASGQTITTVPADASPVRVNNRLRAAIDAACAAFPAWAAAGRRRSVVFPPARWTRRRRRGPEPAVRGQPGGGREGSVA